MQVEFLLLEYVHDRYEVPGIVIAAAYRQVFGSGETRCQLKEGWQRDVREPHQRSYIKIVVGALQSAKVSTRTETWMELEQSDGQTTYLRVARRGVCEEEAITEMLVVGTH